MRVVIVEDEIRIREGIQGLLEMMGNGFEFAGSADNGKAGLELLKKVQPDIVITDIRMPDMSGLEMLREMRVQKISASAIVVSAYSEFEYARQAMRLGVTEYLLKPVSVDEFTKAMNTVKNQIEKERDNQPGPLGTLDQIMGAVLYGQLKLDAGTKEYLLDKYGIHPQQKIAEVCVYLGAFYKDKADRVQREWMNLLSVKGDLKFSIVKADYEQSLLIAIYQFGDIQKLERRIQCWMFQDTDRMAPGGVGWILAEGMANLKEAFDTLYQYMDWTLTLGRDVLIAYPKILQVQTEVCIYPIELENRLKAELCLGNVEQVHRILQNFFAYFSSGKLYTPKNIKECYVRFAWAVITITKEINLLDYESLNQQEMLDKIMRAKLFRELEGILSELLGRICLEKGQEDGTAHLTVRRMKSMIHEFYQSGITLDEIAMKLNVTPEYLSMQFHKEVGETYSSYLKKYRVTKAKELLVGTQMKQYEIAGQVGYTDSRYFGKVFRELTGYSPAEYRKTHK
ncbi:MAG: response regulator [Lachnospiraceae bacterium]|nr:response regulator [Lachnospiraceae bacterium]